MKNSRWLSLIVLCTGFLLIVVDMTIVNVALPSIQVALGFSQSGLAWVVNAYLIAFGGLLLLAGRVGDLLGRKRVYLVGLTIFTGASVLCGLSFAQPMLIGARFVQGIGGAVSSAVILAMIVTLFPEPLERAKAFGIFSFVASAGAAVGLLAGGLITQAVSWHWIFFVNLPIGIITAIAAARMLDSDKGIGLGHGADGLGAIMVTSALMLGGATIVETSDCGLRPDGDWARLPARGHRDGSLLDPLLGAADQPVRRRRDAGDRPGRGRAGARDCRLRAGRRELRDPPAGADGAARAGRRAGVSGAHDDRDGGRAPDRRRPCLRSSEHDRPGRWGAWSCGSGDACRLPLAGVGPQWHRCHHRIGGGIPPFMAYRGPHRRRGPRPLWGGASPSDRGPAWPGVPAF